MVNKLSVKKRIIVILIILSVAGTIVVRGNWVASGMNTISEFDMVDTHTIPVAGFRESFIIKPDGSLWAWGNNTYSQLGTESRIRRYNEPIHIMDGVASVYTGSMRTFALTIDGDLYSWGSNNFSSSGCDDGRLYRVRVMEDIAYFFNFSTTGFAVTTSGELYYIRRQNQPYMPMSFLIDFIMRDVKYTNGNFAVTTNGRLYYLGLWPFSSQGLGAQIRSGEAVPIFIMDDVVRLATGDNTYLILRNDDTLWIANRLRCTDNPVETTKVMDEVAYVTTGGRSGGVAAIRTDGTLWTWRGSRSSGHTTHRFQEEFKGKYEYVYAAATPAQILDDVVAVSLYGRHSMAITSDGTLWSFGTGPGLGRITPEHRYAPEIIMRSVAAVSVGLEHTVVVRLDGSIWTFGLNGTGQLGDGTTRRQLRPTMITTIPIE